MNPFEMVVAIIALVTIGSVLKAKHRNQARGADVTDTLETRQLRDEVRSLKERIQVLERVITDNEGSLRLDHEIERLRDNNRV